MQQVLLSRRDAVFGGLWLCCLPTRLSAQAPPRPAVMVEVAPGLHVRQGLTADTTAENRGAIANLSFVIGRDAVAVIDPGGSLYDGQSLRLAIRAITPLPVRYVVLSHVHPDHIFGAAAFAEDEPVVVGHANLPEHLAARGEFYRQGLERIVGAGSRERVIAPTLLVRERAELDLGGRVLALTAHKPAHTASDLSAVDRQTGVLLTGDLLFVDRIPVLDGDLKGWLAELAAISASGVQRAIPGHGPPLVDWAPAEAAQRRYLQALLDDTRAAIKSGKSIEDAASSVARFEQSRWALFDDFHGRNVTQAYRRLEWE